MNFLIDACLPRDMLQLLESYGHSAIDVRDIGLRHADDHVIAAYAREHRLCLLTEDWGFADIRAYPPAEYFGIVLIEASDNRIDQKLSTLRHFLDHPNIIAAISGRLAIVTLTSIRLRPPI